MINNIIKKPFIFIKNILLNNYIKIFISITIAFTIITLVTMGGYTSFSNDALMVEVFVSITSLLLLFFSIIIANKVFYLYMANKKGEAGVVIQNKIAIWFTILTAGPTITIGIFSILFFDYGLKGWFSERIDAALLSGSVVNESYLNEHRKNIVGGLFKISRKIERYDLDSLRSEEFRQKFIEFSSKENMSHAMVFDLEGNIYSRYGFTAKLEINPIPVRFFNKANNDEVVVIKDINDESTLAMIKLKYTKNVYIIVGKFIDNEILNYIDKSNKAISDYRFLKISNSKIKFTFSVIFILVVILILFITLYFGFVFSESLVKPIKILVNASKKIKNQKYDTKIIDNIEYQEFKELISSFNIMASEIESSTNKLKQANVNIDKRRRFTEAVLAAIDTIVVTVNRSYEIKFINHKGELAINKKFDNTFLNMHIDDYIPGVSNLLKLVSESKVKKSQEFNIGNKTYFVTTVPEFNKKNNISNYVITINDISLFEQAQKMAAWSDVARKVAHEIKNPLTPILLSAERIERRFGKKVDDEKDQKIFNECVSTITKKVTEIERMIDQFSSFAKMPDVVLNKNNIVEIIKKAISLEKNANINIEYVFNTNLTEKIMFVDRQLLGQAFYNILKNAVISINSSNNREKGKIIINLREIKKEILLDIHDNGVGIDDKIKESLFEPYVTFSKDGSGLGLPIVKKIIEDHNGNISIDNSNILTGAVINIKFIENTNE